MAKSGAFTALVNDIVNLQDVASKNGKILRLTFYPSSDAVPNPDALYDLDTIMQVEIYALPAANK